MPVACLLACLPLEDHPPPVLPFSRATVDVSTETRIRNPTSTHSGTHYVRPGVTSQGTGEPYAATAHGHGHTVLARRLQPRPRPLLLLLLALLPPLLRSPPARPSPASPGHRSACPTRDSCSRCGSVAPATAAAATAVPGTLRTLRTAKCGPWDRGSAAEPSGEPRIHSCLHTNRADDIAPSGLAKLTHSPGPIATPRLFSAPASINIPAERAKPSTWLRRSLHSAPTTPDPDLPPTS